MKESVPALSATPSASASAAPQARMEKCVATHLHKQLHVLQKTEGSHSRHQLSRSSSLPKLRDRCLAASGVLDSCQLFRRLFCQFEPHNSRAEGRCLVHVPGEPCEFHCHSSEIKSGLAALLQASPNPCFCSQKQRSEARKANPVCCSSGPSLKRTISAERQSRGIRGHPVCRRKTAQVHEHQFSKLASF